MLNSLPFLLVIALLGALLAVQQFLHQRTTTKLMQLLCSKESIPWTSTAVEPPQPKAEKPRRVISVPLPVGPWSRAPVPPSKDRL